jgi:potassium-transporting ATPase KdpC subunit
MRLLRTAVLLFFSLTIMTGVVYPALVTLIGQLAFPEQAGGSLIRNQDGVLIGSRLIGQPFSNPGYFWPRPSATDDFPYNPLASGGANLGPTNPVLLNTVAARIKSLEETGLPGPVPSDLVLASGSGLDPHISLEAAVLQIPRVERFRQVGAERLRQLVQDHLEDRQLGFLGVPRLNVVKLNLALDKLEAHDR